MRGSITLTIPPEKIAWRDDDIDDRRGSVDVEIFRTWHHLMLLPVRIDRKGSISGRTKFADQDLANLGMLYPFPPLTIEIPGRTGLYVACMYPHSSA